MVHSSNFRSSLWLLVALVGVVATAEDPRQDPQQTSAKLQSTKQKSQNDTACGTLYDLAHKVEVCAKPLMDILQGTIEKWPTNEKETSDLCSSFALSERCIRDTGRRCAHGLQKTILSTLATSVQRTRKRECNPKLQNILKTTKCIEKNQILIQTMIANITARLKVVELQMPDLDVKTNAVCCMVHEIEKDIKTTLEPVCKEESQTVVKLYHAALEDVIEIICRSPKCNDIFRGYKIPKPVVTSNIGIIAILLRIVFSLGG